MDNRIMIMRESMTEINGKKAYFFHFENCLRKEIALVSWFVSPDEEKQSLCLSIEHGEIDQLTNLLNTYFTAKTAANTFDRHELTFIFEQYARNEKLDIIWD